MHFSRPTLFAALIALTISACSSTAVDAAPGKAGTTTEKATRAGFAPAPLVPAGAEEAIFAGGCFWCMESAFQEEDGVLSVTSGYIGGHQPSPTYRQVSSRQSGHAEAILVVFQPQKITYKKLLEIFWHNIDPTTDDRQFCDVGDEYRPEIFFKGSAQQKAALASKQALIKASASKQGTFHGEVLVPITKASQFWTAEGYHQDYYKKNPGRYWSYRAGCGRDRRLRELWGPGAGHQRGQ